MILNIDKHNFSLQVCLLAVAAVASAVKQETKTVTRRGIWAEEQIPSYNGYNQYSSGGYEANNYANSYAGSGFNVLSSNGIRQIIGSREPIRETVVNRVVHVPVPVPHPVEVVRAVPVKVPQPYPVEVRRPVPVRVAQPYPVHVNKPYPVHVDRPVPVLVPHVARVTYPRVPVPVQVPQPYAVALQASGINYPGQVQVQGLGAYAGQAGPSSYANLQTGPSSYVSQSGYSGDSYSYPQYTEAASGTGSWGGASYPGLESSGSEGYSYEPPAKRW